MTEQAAEARRAYKREWAKKHPEKVKAYTERHWEKVAKEAEAQRKIEAGLDLQKGNKEE